MTFDAAGIARAARFILDASLHAAFQGGCHTAVISPEGRYLAGPLPEGEGLAIAVLDRSLITKRKRMMDSVGHYSRPDLLGLRLNASPARQVEAMGVVADGGPRAEGFPQAGWPLEAPAAPAAALALEVPHV